MREDLLTWLVGPETRLPLQLEVFATKKLAEFDHVWEGRLYNSREDFPITQGVPRLLPLALLQNTMKRYPDFVARYQERFQTPLQAEGMSDLKQRTQDSFGEQWNIFAHMYQEWKEHFLDFISPHLAPADFQGAQVADCGCGFGRHLYYTAEFGAKTAIGFDLSHAVDAALHTVAKFPHAHVVQGDIYHPPLVNEFDLVYTVGVLQHLPDPYEAALALSRLVKPNGTFFAWIYGPRPLSYHLCVDSLRAVTTRMNRRVLYYFSFLLALGSFTGFALPRRFLTKIGLEKIGGRIPFGRYALYPFKVSHADWFDRLAAPKTAYFSEEEAWKLIAQLQFDQPKMTFRQGGSWRISAVKPASHT